MERESLLAELVANGPGIENGAKSAASKEGGKAELRLWAGDAMLDDKTPGEKNPGFSRGEFGLGEGE